jgi:DNA-binding protein HU-beta
MTRNEFVRLVADRSGMSQRDAGRAVDAFLETIQETLKRGDEVSFTGFGKFMASERAARQGVNPRTGERIQIAASKVPRFSASSGFKRAVSSLPGNGDTTY